MFTKVDDGDLPCTINDCISLSIIILKITGKKCCSILVAKYKTKSNIKLIIYMKLKLLVRGGSVWANLSVKI
jgi:hypothetical protein